MNNILFFTIIALVSAQLQPPTPQNTTLTAPKNETATSSQSKVNAEAFDTFAKTIEELITEQHGKQEFNDALTNVDRSNYILSNPDVLATEAELDKLLNSLKHSYDVVNDHSHLVPTFTYTSKTKEQIAFEAQAKQQRKEQQLLEELAKLPRNCTADTLDGTPCVGGKCFHGSCRPTSHCAEDCCDDYGMAKLNGVLCAGGECAQGRCLAVPPCFGECCDTTYKNPRPDGTVCSVGFCRAGGCVADRTPCVSGACCKETLGTMQPKGFHCTVNPCQKPSNCTGYSEYCPDSSPVEDGAYCPNGYCQRGVCVREIDVSSREPICTEGQCCDLTTFAYLVKGTPCANNPCMDGATCLGNSEQCPPPAFQVPNKNGTKCPDGLCWNGHCKPLVECDDGECCRAGKMLSNYTSCSEGRCFNGKCVYDRHCLGDCCDPEVDPDTPKALINGSPCKGGICIAGRCRKPPTCFGECCANADATVAKTDGMQCNHGKGYCSGGMCVSPNITCESGQCCNAHLGHAFPANFPCHSSPCRKSMPCFGNSSICLDSTEYKPEGYPCPGNGTCESGECILPPPIVPECVDGLCCNVRRNRYAVAGTPCGTDPCKEPTYCTGHSQYCPITLVPIEDGVICKQTLLGNWTCVEGVCEKPKPKPILPRCNVEKACCDVFKQRVRPNGTVCAESFNECVNTAMCNGFDPDCPIAYRPDGSVCSGGMCVHGQCIFGVDPLDNDTIHDIHVHHTRSNNNELITITTTRKSDGSTFSKEHFIETDQILAMQKQAEAKATEELKRITEEKKAEKAKIRQEQFDKDVNETIRRMEETEAKRIANMSRAELEEYLAKQNSTDSEKAEIEAENAKKRDEEKTPEELEDETAEHGLFVDTLDHENNPIRHLAHLNAPITHEYQQCTAGMCCNKRLNVFFPYGHICGQPKSECQVAICSGQSTECYPINVVDGFRCPNGNCFEGECIRRCYGDCCDRGIAKKDGEECEDNGKCFNGVCVKPCYGDCCEVNMNFAKPDGAPCFEGTCEEGRCIRESADVVNVLFPEEMKDPLNGQKAIAVVVDEKKKQTELESLWGNLVAVEEKEREELRKKKIAEREALVEAEKKKIQEEADGKVADLKAANTSDNSENRYWLFGIISGGALVALLIIVLIIVALVSRSRRHEREKKEAQDSEYYYEKF